MVAGGGRQPLARAPPPFPNPPPTRKLRPNLALFLRSFEKKLLAPVGRCHRERWVAVEVGGLGGEGGRGGARWGEGAEEGG